MVRISLIATLIALIGGCDSSSSSDIAGDAGNAAPVAQAGNNQTVPVGTTATLDASASTDADGDALSFSWAITSSPGNRAVLSSSSGPSTSLTPDVSGEYLVTVTVTDGFATSTDSTTVTATELVSNTGALTTGTGSTTIGDLFPMGSRVAPVGEVASNDGVVWTVPADVRFDDDLFPVASDLYNIYNTGNTFANSADALANLSTANIVEIDSRGELITGFVFADNYFEMYINGTPVGKDAVPFTEFNSSIVQFRVNVPFTVAMLLVDWEENLGTGTELSAGTAFRPGDGGMVAVFRNESGEIIGKTDTSWKAQSFYIAPLTDPDCATFSGNRRLTTSCSETVSTDLSTVSALHWSLDSNWFDPSFDDSDWPTAVAYSNAEVGVDNKPAYTNFTDLFNSSENEAEFIWTSSLVFDNEVAVRKVVGQETSVLSSLCNIGLVDSATMTSCSGDTAVIESNGRVDDIYYPMMAGIQENGWNGQYPVEQDYNGNNAFVFPLTPELATEPRIQIRNAVGMAVNGIPIFFPQTPGSTGQPSCILETSTDGCLRDAIVDGEMDRCGGHAGRGNDYHYHQLTNEPGCLIDIVANEIGPDAPVGIMYDGFSVYPRVLDGSTEFGYTYQDALSGSTNTNLLSIYEESVSLDDSCGGYRSADGDVYYAVTDGFPYISNCLVGTYDPNSAVRTQGAFTDNTPVSGAITDYYVEEQSGGIVCHYLVFASGQITEFCE